VAVDDRNHCCSDGIFQMSKKGNVWYIFYGIVYGRDRDLACLGDIQVVNLQLHLCSAYVSCFSSLRRISVAVFLYGPLCSHDSFIEEISNTVPISMSA
jgi:hypothetical protein